jgi:hypothetical protein
VLNTAPQNVLLCLDSEKHFVFRVSAQRYADRMNAFRPIMVPMGDGTEQPLNIWEVVKI